MKFSESTAVLQRTTGNRPSKSFPTPPNASSQYLLKVKGNWEIRLYVFIQPDLNSFKNDSAHRRGTTPSSVLWLLVYFRGLKILLAGLITSSAVSQGSGDGDPGSFSNNFALVVLERTGNVSVYMCVCACVCVFRERKKQKTVGPSRMAAECACAAAAPATRRTSGRPCRRGSTRSRSSSTTGTGTGAAGTSYACILLRAERGHGWAPGRHSHTRPRAHRRLSRGITASNGRAESERKKTNAEILTFMKKGVNNLYGRRIWRRRVHLAPETNPTL